MNIAVIGSGYVGLVTGACFAEFGVDVICVDVAVDKIERLTRGDSPIYEPGLEQLIKKNLQAGRLSFTTDIASAIKQSLVVFIAVGTPALPDGSADRRKILHAVPGFGGSCFPKDRTALSAIGRQFSS